LCPLPASVTFSSAGGTAVGPLEGPVPTVTYGEIGKAGRTWTKAFPTPQAIDERDRSRLLAAVADHDVSGVDRVDLGGTAVLVAETEVEPVVVVLVDPLENLPLRDGHVERLGVRGRVERDGVEPVRAVDAEAELAGLDEEVEDLGRVVLVGDLRLAAVEQAEDVVATLLALARRLDSPRSRESLELGRDRTLCFLLRGRRCDQDGEHY